MKYFLFGGTRYYPEGGACDLLGCYESIDAAEQQWLAWLNDASWCERNLIIEDTVTWAHVAQIREGALTVVSGYQRVHMDDPEMTWKRETIQRRIEHLPEPRDYIEATLIEAGLAKEGDAAWVVDPQKIKATAQRLAARRVLGSQ